MLPDTDQGQQECEAANGLLLFDYYNYRYFYCGIKEYKIEAILHVGAIRICF